MRTLARNKQKMHYSLYLGQKPEYVLDENGMKVVEFIDEEGNVYYQETGNYIDVYSQPVIFYGNIAMSGGESEAKEFGIDVSAYDAVLITAKKAIPIDETSLIWFESEVEYADEEKTMPNQFTADYKILAVKPSLNFSKYVLGRVVK